MWTYPDDNTSPVITAREHIFAPHSGASAPELPETALLFYMGGAIEHLLNTRPCVQLAEKLPRFLYGCPVYGYRGVCFLDGGRGAPQAADTLETLAALGVKRVLACAARLWKAFRKGRSWLPIARTPRRARRFTITPRLNLPSRTRSCSAR